MKKSPNKSLTQLADAAFKQAAQEVVKRAKETGTPVIICVDGEIKAVQPSELTKGRKRTGHGRTKGP
ncbi:MAG TPA: hypothetical protein VMS17_07405 [Gemmataceae bacterium]|nr:hypothetical protein [Gemmataceae bacterium]